MPAVSQEQSTIHRAAPDGADFSPAYFERMAALEDTHPWTRSMRAITLDLLLRNRGFGPCRLLDVGCGTGRFLHEWQARAPVGLRVGIDLHLEALQRARVRCDAALAAASASALPWAGKSFDAIHCADVLQHLSLGDADRALDEFARLLCPGGLLALRVRAPAMFGPRTDRDFAHSYEPPALRAALRLRGFEIILLTRVNALPSLWGEIASRASRGRAQHAAVKHIRLHRNRDIRARLLDAYLRIERIFISRLGIRFPVGHTILCLARLEDERGKVTPGRGRTDGGA